MGYPILTRSEDQLWACLKSCIKPLSWSWPLNPQVLMMSCPTYSQLFGYTVYMKNASGTSKLRQIVGWEVAAKTIFFWDWRTWRNSSGNDGGDGSSGRTPWQFANWNITPFLVGKYTKTFIIQTLKKMVHFIYISNYDHNGYFFKISKVLGSPADFIRTWWSKCPNRRRSFFVSQRRMPIWFNGHVHTL